MANRDIVVIGASAGGLSALRALVNGLPGDFAAAVFVVVHVSPDSPGLLPQILASAGRLPAAHARHEEPIETGRIYVAPPDRHLLVDATRKVRIGHGPKENRFRPAVDPLFRSAALACGPRVIGIVLSGGLDDGTAGLKAIKQAGGIAIAQDPEEAEVPSMPASALRHVAVDHCVKAGEMPALLEKLVGESFDLAKDAQVAMPNQLEIEVNVQLDQSKREPAILELGEPSLFTCPDCHGSLLEVRDAVPARFRCHTGHGYTSASLDAELGEKIEDALWNAVRALEEHAMLLKQMSEHEDADAGEPKRLRARDSLRRVSLLREALAGNGAGEAG